jgi:hypothetical protein
MCLAVPSVLPNVVSTGYLALPGLSVLPTVLPTGHSLLTVGPSVLPIVRIKTFETKLQPSIGQNLRVFRHGPCKAGEYGSDWLVRTTTIGWPHERIDTVTPPATLLFSGPCRTQSNH